MKKILYIIITLLSLTGFTTCLTLKGTYNEFSSSNVKNNISYLSSKELKGRLPGTNENYIVASEIEEAFEDYNLKPLGNSYKQSFKVMTPIYTNEQCSMKILDGDKIVKEFSVGKDFKEDMINFKNTSIQFTKKDKITLYQRAISIIKDNIEYLFSVNTDNNFSFRSSFINNSPYGFAIQISTEVFNDILDSLREGYTLDINLPYKVEEKEVYNVVGKISGIDKSLPPLIFTAHYDHVGVDSTGNIYGGALDNASGTSFLLELAKTYSSLKMPNRDIIFVALNCEEFGLLGSNEFASKYKEEFKGAQVINFDMIGAKDFPVTFMGGTNNKDAKSELLNDLKAICDEKGIETLTNYQDASDHASFINNGFDSYTISHADTSNIHTPKDTVDKISTEAISTVYEVINCKVLDYAYNDNFLVFYNNKTLILFSITSFGLIAIGIIEFNKKKNDNRGLSA